MAPNSVSIPTLITFPPSLDSELGRFLVQHYGIQCCEKRHALIFSSFATLRHGGTVIFPLLYDEFLKLAGPLAIASYYESRCAPPRRLWPAAFNERQTLESDWTLFNKSLAIATAVFAYYHLLPHRQMMVEPLSSDTSRFEQRAVHRGYSAFAGLLRVLLRLNRQHADQSLDLVRKIFTGVEARLAGGRSYLVGDRLTLSDLAFAVAAAPVVLPPNYGGPIPPFEQMPSAVQTVVTEMRARPAGAFALRIYQEERDRCGLGA